MLKLQNWINNPYLRRYKMPTSTTATIFDTNNAEEINTDKISQEYEKLNEKCDTVITKIKKRKQKQSKKIN